MPIAAIFAEEAAVALAAELAPYAAGEAALAASSLLGAEALMGLGAEALGAGAVGGAEAALAADAMAANAAAGGAGAGGAGINAAQVAAQQNAAMQLANPGITGIPEIMSPAQQAYQAASSASATPGITPGVQPLPAPTNAFPPYPPLEVGNNPFNSAFPQYSNFQAAPPAAPPDVPRSLFNPSATPPPPVNTMGLEMPGAYSPGNIQGADPNFFNQSATVAPGPGPLPNPQYQLNAPSTGQSMRLGTGLNSIPTPGPISSVLPPPSALQVGMDSAVQWAKANPFPAMTGAYIGASALGLLNPSGNTFNDKPYDGPLSRYRLSPNFQGSTANPADFQYNPATNRRYAEGGGIMGVDPYAIPVGYAEGDVVNEDFLLANNPQGMQGADQYGQGAGMGYLEMGGNYGAAPVMSEDQRRYERDVAMDNMSMNNNPQGLKGADPYGQGAAMGYVEGYARGGSLSDSIASYQKMLGGQPQAAPAASRDVGIYYDQDPDTRYQDALTAAQIRQAKVNQRAYVSPPVAKRPTPMGKLDMPTSAKNKGESVEARHGGIMHASLGNYAAGGNPRLLKGPGDGMSDNIPATINGRQPARLADGEFVIPADVVSHLGNGSTEAGAKQLHAMMNKIRKARTGNSKQGKQINAEKYMPK